MCRTQRQIYMPILCFICNYQILWIIYNQGWVFLHHVLTSAVHVLLLHIPFLFVTLMAYRNHCLIPPYISFLQCTVTCGQGLRYRVVLCIDHRGIHTGGCSSKTKPHIKEECIVPTPCYKPKGNERMILINFSAFVHVEQFCSVISLHLQWILHLYI